MGKIGYATKQKVVTVGTTPRKFPTPDEPKDDRDEIDTGTVISFPIENGILKKRQNSKKNQKFPHCNFVINHEGRFKVLWDWIILVLVIFTAIQIPYYATFKRTHSTFLDILGESDIQPILLLSVLVDLMFVLDIFINFRTTYIHSSSDLIERNPKKLAIHYLKTWFIIDLLAAIPFDLIMHSSDPGNSSILVGLLKSARLLRLFRVARKLDRYSEYGVAVLFLLMSLFTLIAHWFACIWHAIAESEKNNDNSWAFQMTTLLYGENKTTGNPIGKMTDSEKYIASLYFIVSAMTSVGFGNIAATTEREQVFTVIIMLIGALMYACIFGNMVAIVQRLYSKASTFHTQLKAVQEFLRYYQIPEEVSASIHNYARREWNLSRGIDTDDILQRFPECLQADLTYQLYHKLFSKIKPLQKATVSCMRALAMKFKTITLQKNSFLIRQGERLDKFFVLGRGCLEIEIDGKIVSYLARYATFGYDMVNIPQRPKSKANVRATNLVEIHYISKEDLLDIMETYPKFTTQFKQTYTHGYDLNDDEEEGYQEVERKNKDRTRVGTLAKHALKLPLLATLAKSNFVSKKCSKSTHEESSQISNSTTFDQSSRYQFTNGGGSIGCLNHETEFNNSISADHLNFVNCSIQSSATEVHHNNLQDNQTKVALECHSYLTLPSVSDQQSSSQLKCTSPSVDIKSVCESSLELKISALQSELNEMKSEFNNKLSTLIEMLQNMQNTADRANCTKYNRKNLIHEQQTSPQNVSLETKEL